MLFLRWPTDMAVAWATGEVWMKVLTASRSRSMAGKTVATGKDVIPSHHRSIGVEANYMAMEFSGDGIAELRWTIALPLAIW